MHDTRYTCKVREGKVNFIISKEKLQCGLYTVVHSNFNCYKILRNTTCTCFPTKYLPCFSSQDITTTTTTTTAKTTTMMTITATAIIILIFSYRSVTKCVIAG